MDKQDFVFKSIAAMNNYRQAKKRIEFLTVGQSLESTENIMKNYQILLDTMTLKGGFPIVKDYSGCVVNSNHIHVLIKKPFVMSEVLRNSWQRISGKDSNITCKSVTNTPSSVDRLISYIANQGDSHETYDVKFFDTPRWGIVTKQKLTDAEKIQRRNKIEQNKIKKSRQNVDRMIYDSITGLMREETDEDKQKMKDNLKNWSKEMQNKHELGESWQ